MARSPKVVQSIPCALQEVIETTESGGFKEKIELERRGVPLQAIKQLASRLGWKIEDLLGEIGCAEQLRFARGTTRVSGPAGLKCIEIVRTLLLARSLYESSTATDKPFDVDSWLGRWLLRPAVAFASQRPVDWHDTPSAAEYTRYALRASNLGVFI
jgi:hypothetical protein